MNWADILGLKIVAPEQAQKLLTQAKQLDPRLRKMIEDLENSPHVITIICVESVPPVQMIFGQVGFAGLAPGRPGTGHEKIALHAGHGPVSPAGAPLLAFNRGNKILAVVVAQIETGRKIPGRGRYRRQQ